jgi:hypothetical protein
MKTPLPAPNCPDTDGTTHRIIAFLASVQPISGAGQGRDAGFHRGRSIIERMAMSADGAGIPDITLAPDHCADVLEFLANIEPLEPESWWQDPSEGPSHLVGFQFVLQVLSASLQPSERQPRPPADNRILQFVDYRTGAPIAGLPAPLPCPFCGKTDVGILIAGKVLLAYAECGHCGIECGHAGLEDGVEDSEASRLEMTWRVATFWNTRTDPEPKSMEGQS